MPKITITPVKFVDISVRIVDLSPEQKTIFIAMVDEITASFVPSGFVDPAVLDAYHEWIDVRERIASDQAADFVQKVCQAYDLVIASEN